MRPEPLLNSFAAEIPTADSEVVPDHTFKTNPRSKSAKIEAASDRFVNLFKRVAVSKREEKS